MAKSKKLGDSHSYLYYGASKLNAHGICKEKKPMIIDLLSPVTLYFGWNAESLAPFL